MIEHIGANDKICFDCGELIKIILFGVKNRHMSGFHILIPFFKMESTPEPVQAIQANFIPDILRGNA